MCCQFIASSLGRKTSSINVDGLALILAGFVEKKEPVKVLRANMVFSECFKQNWKTQSLGDGKVCLNFRKGANETIPRSSLARPWLVFGFPGLPCDSFSFQRSHFAISPGSAFQSLLSSCLGRKSL